MGRRLSDRQRRAIISIGEGQIDLAREIDRRRAIVEAHPELADEMRIPIGEYLRLWGSSWRPGSRDASERAAWSRSLRRLEERGLAIRTNRFRGPNASEPRPPRTRTIGVLLTVTGWEVFRRLTGEGAPASAPRVDGSERPAWPG
jgi:hypothetical protein